MPRGNQRFTVYDAMEARGVFENNPANSSSPEHVRFEYPKMYYHPEGKRKIIVPGELISTLLGPKLVGQQSELIWKLVSSEDEEKKAVEDGWHDHPTKALKAAGEDVQQSDADRLLDANEQIAQLKAALAATQKATNTSMPKKA